MKQSITIILLLQLILLSIVSCGWFDTLFDSRTRESDGIPIQSIQSLVFQSNKYTTGRRNTPIKQINCISKNKQQRELCDNHSPNSILCKNVGFDGIDVNWQCTGELDTGIKFDTIDVICEGYNTPDDSVILKGSCGVEYTLTGTPIKTSTTEQIHYNPSPVQSNQINDKYNNMPKTNVMSPDHVYDKYQRTKSYLSSILDYVLPSPINTLLGRTTPDQSLASTIFNTLFGYSITNTIYNRIFGHNSIYNMIFGGKQHGSTPSLSEFISGKSSPHYTHDDTSSWLTTILMYIITAAIMYSIYKTLSSTYNPPRNNVRRPAAPRRSFRLDDNNNNNGNGDDDSDGDIPPPSYGQSHAHPTSDNTTKRKSQPRTTTAPSSARDGPGFYSGAVLGAGLGYLFGNRGGSANTQQQQSTQPRAVYQEPTVSHTSSVPSQPVVVTRSTTPATTTSNAYATTKRR